MHTAKIIETKKLADGAIAVLARCCDDPSTDSWHTIYNLHAKESSDIQREATDHASNVEMKHLATQRADQALADLQNLISQ
jgi:hypothetical protein